MVTRPLMSVCTGGSSTSSPLLGIAVTVATVLRIETGDTFRREGLLAALATSIDSNARILATGGAVPVLTLFSAASTYTEGKRVEVDMPGGLVRGTTAGLTADGFLRLRKDDGSETVVTAGGVRPLHE